MYTTLSRRNCCVVYFVLAENLERNLELLVVLTATIEIITRQ